MPPIPAPRSWRERWLSFRNGCVASPAFQRWAAGFPLTRGIAQRNTRALFDLCAGFVYSQVLFACVRLDLFRILQSGPKSIEDLSRRLGLSPERTERLLKAAASLNLVTLLQDGRYALADLGAALTGNPSVAAMIEHHAMLYADLADPVALLRGEAGPTRLGQYWLYADHASLGRASEEAVAGYSGLMSASQALIAEDILDAYPLGGHGRLMDVGGGEGAFIAAVARRHAALRLTLFDLPPVAQRAAERLAGLGFGARVECLSGSFHTDILPGGADVISLVRILHDHDDAQAAVLVQAARDALPPGGTILIAEPLADTRGAEPIGDAYFGFYLLAMGSGRARTAAEIRTMLAVGGFTEIQEISTRRPLLTRLITAKRSRNV
ncbi:methyltransferase [Methylobacterium sp. C25]|nr:methyltransferase [Methylobacterium sp. C25]